MDRKALTAFLLPLATIALAACSDTRTPTAPLRPSLSAQAGKASHVHQRHIAKNGHVYSIAAADNSESGKPTAAFYMFVDGQIQSVTSVVYTRTNGVWTRKRARTTVFENGRPVHQVTLDAKRRAAAASFWPTRFLGQAGVRAGARLLSFAKLALPDALQAQTAAYYDQQALAAAQDLASAQSQLEADNALCGGGGGGCGAIPGDEAQVSNDAASLQSALDALGAAGWSSSFDGGGGGSYDQSLYDAIDGFIASAGNGFCGADYCIYLAE